MWGLVVVFNHPTREVLSLQKLHFTRKFLDLEIRGLFFLFFLTRRKYEAGMYVEASSKKEDEGVGLWQ